MGASVQCSGWLTVVDMHHVVCIMMAFGERMGGARGFSLLLWIGLSELLLRNYCFYIITVLLQSKVIHGVIAVNLCIGKTLPLD